jgi:hypothetical protein
MVKHAIASSFAVLALIVVHCGGGTSPVDPNRTPKVHRASAMTCDDMRPPGIADAGLESGAPDSGVPDQCNQDSDCTMGKDGRCGYSRIGKQCSYDTCFADADCGNNGVCVCRTGGSNNHCAGGGGPGACRVDADCGAKGFCSPSAGSCGPGYGIQGYFCHTSSDTCVDDSDCQDGGLAGYCMFETTVKKWQCSNSICAG